MDLTDVLQRVLSGDRQAYSEVVRHYERPLFGFLGRMGLSQPRAEDIAQEAFLRAWMSLPDFDPRRARFATWLFTIARRLALNELTRTARRQEVSMTTRHDGKCEGLPPEDTLVLSERHQQLRAALLALPAADRTALALAYIGDFSLAEIARIEGSTVGAIKTRLHRARARLGSLLGTDDA